MWVKEIKLKILAPVEVINETEIWFINYGFSFDEIEEVIEHVQTLMKKR